MWSLLHFFDILFSGLFSKLPYRRKMFGVADYTFDNGLLEAIMIFQEMSSSPGSI